LSQLPVFTASPDPETGLMNNAIFFVCGSQAGLGDKYKESICKPVR